MDRSGVTSTRLFPEVDGVMRTDAAVAPPPPLPFTPPPPLSKLTPPAGLFTSAGTACPPSRMGKEMDPRVPPLLAGVRAAAVGEEEGDAEAARAAATGDGDAATAAASSVIGGGGGGGHGADM